VTNWRERLDTFLVARGLKQSKQRLKLVDFILSLPGHFGIQELVQQVRRRFPEMGTATVYRNVKTLCEAGILRETLTDANDRVVYELADDDDHHHDHIVCLDCQEIFEFHNEKLEVIQDQTTEKLGFNPVSHRHVVYARCRYSAASAKKN
jgi:Fur family ferric uptake transcriptional regulator